MAHSTARRPADPAAGAVATGGSPARRGRRTPSARPGYVGSVIGSLATAWIANHLLGWGWPSFLTPAFADLLPWINASLAASIVANLVWVVHDPPALKHLGQLALDLVGIVVVVRSWQIFPFDLSGSWSGWEVVVRGLHGIAMVGLVIDAAVCGAGLSRDRRQP